MEEEVEKCLDEMTKSPDAVAALCIDEQGLTLGRRGADFFAAPTSAESSSTAGTDFKQGDANGAVVALAEAASNIDSEFSSPVIVVDTKESRYMVHRSGRVTSLVVLKRDADGSVAGSMSGEMGQSPQD